MARFLEPFVGQTLVPLLKYEQNSKFTIIQTNRCLKSTQEPELTKSLEG